MSIAESAEISSYSIACVWEQQQLRVLKSFAPYLSSRAFDINNAGQVIGSAERSEGEWEYAVIWEPDGSLHVIPHGGSVLFIGSINEAGHVSGSIRWQQGDPTHAVIWNGEQIIDYHPQGSEEDESIGGPINDLGHMIGKVGTAPVLWLKPGQYFRIRDLLPPNNGWNLYKLPLSDINNHDQIVGSTQHWNERSRGFLMTPVYPELELSHPVPQIAGEMNTWTIIGAEPGAKITFVYGFKGGGAVINTECDLLDAVIQLDDAKYSGQRHRRRSRRRDADAVRPGTCARIAGRDDPGV
jgi:hypothetical protein